MQARVSLPEPAPVLPLKQAQRYFDDAEYERRRNAVRVAMAARGLDACVIAAPENVYYLTGLDHQGYFACQLLVLPIEGQPILITRAMERATVRDLAPDVIHVGYVDGHVAVPQACGSVLDAALGMPLTSSLPMRRRPLLPPSAAVLDTVGALRSAGLARGTLGIDMSSTFLPYAVAEGIMDGTPDAEWQHLESLVDDVRCAQSPVELELTRKAGAIADAIMNAAIEAAHPGVNVREILAAIYEAMIRAGGTYPGFIPLVRSTTTLAHEHCTWEDETVEAGEVLFLEMAGCVRRYHAPLGRFVFIGHASDDAQAINAICQETMAAAAAAIRPGVLAGEVYEAWQAVLDRYGLDHYLRHHCGYSVGIGFPPSWSGGGVPVGLRRNSTLPLREGMTFHLMSWLLNSGRGDAFLSDTIEVTADGCRFLTSVDRSVLIR